MLAPDAFRRAEPFVPGLWIFEGDMALVRHIVKR